MNATQIHRENRHHFALARWPLGPPWASVVALLIAACGGTKVTPSVTVEAVPLPSASVPSPTPTAHALDVSVFFDAGCKSMNDASLIDCTGARIAGIAKCRMPLHVLPVTFEPPAVVAECFVENAPGGIRQTGCMRRSAVMLIAAARSGFDEIDSPDALIKAFGPVASPDEAVAFAVATSGNAWGTKAIGADGPWVHEAADGYHVQLLFSQLCGCSHPTFAIEHLVRRDGVVRELSRRVVFEDPNARGLCVD